MQEANIRNDETTRIELKLNEEIPYTPPTVEDTLPPIDKYKPSSIFGDSSLFFNRPVYPTARKQKSALITEQLVDERQPQTIEVEPAENRRLAASKPPRVVESKSMNRDASRLSVAAYS